MALEGLKSTAMLPIPRKEGEEVDLIAPLRQYIVSSYQQDPSTYDDKLLKIQNLRKEALQAAGDELGAMVLQRYHGQLEYLAMKFRLSDGHVAIPFKWKDAFTGEEGTQTSDTFERASVLFNLGATQATLASEAVRTDVNALKAACAYLQAAAGVFTHIKEKCTGMPTNDLSPNTMNFLIPLMLGQGQECVIERSVMDKGKPSVLAKLCMDCSKQYQQANSAVQDDKKKYDSHAPYSVETAVKQHFFKALAYYYRSVQSAEANEFGPRIAYLKEGIKCVKQAKSTTSRSNLQPTSVAVKELQTKLDAVLAEAIKDNDNVYHELVPESVPELQSVSIVKPSPLLTGPDAAELVGPDIFNTLVPLGVTMSVSQYSEEKAKLLRQAKEEFAACNEDLQKQLDAMHLPGALRQSQSEGPGLPEKLVRRRQNVMDAGGLTAMEDAFKDLTSASEKVKGSVETLRAIMDEEQSNESILKSGDPSHRSNPAMARLVKETTGCVGAFEQALESNALLTERFERAKSALGALCRSDLESMLPAASEEVDPAAAKLESLMTKVDQMTSHRAQLEAELRDMIEHDDITDKLLHNAVYGDGNADRERQIMDEALRKYQDIQGIIRLNIDAQAPLLRAITEANASFVMARQGGKRGEMLRDLESAAETYEYCMDKLNDAQQFWKKMEKMCDDLHLRWADLQGGHPKRTSIPSKPPPPRPASSKPGLPPKPSASAFHPDMGYTPPTAGYVSDHSMSAYNPLAPPLDHGPRGGWSPDLPPLGTFSNPSTGSLPPFGGLNDFKPPPPFNPEMGPLPVANAPPMSAEDAAMLTAMGRLPRSRPSLTGSSTLSGTFSTPNGYGAPFTQPAAPSTGAVAVAPMDQLMQLAQLQPDLFTPEMMALLVQDPALLQALLAGLPPEATQPPTTAAPPAGQATSLMPGATPQTIPLPPVGSLTASMLMPGPVLMQPPGMVAVQPQAPAQPAVSPLSHILMPGPVMLAPAPAPHQAPAHMQQPPAALQPQPQMAPAQTQMAPAQPQMVPAQPQMAPAQPQMVPAQPQMAPAQPQVAPAQPQMVPAQPQMVSVQPKMPPAQPPVPQQPAIQQPVLPVVQQAPAQQPGPSTPQPQPAVQPQPTYQQQPMMAPAQYQQQQPPLQGPSSSQAFAPAQTPYGAPAAQPAPQQYHPAPIGQPQQPAPPMQYVPTPASPPRPVQATQSPGSYGAQYQQQPQGGPTQPPYTAPSQPMQQAAPPMQHLQSPVLSQPSPQQYAQQVQQQQPQAQPMPQWSSPQPQPQTYAPQKQQPQQPPMQPTPPPMQPTPPPMQSIPPPMQPTPPPMQPTPPSQPLTCTMPPPNQGMPSQQPGARQPAPPPQIPLQPQPAPQASPSGQQPYQQPQQQPLPPTPAQAYNHASNFMPPQPQPQAQVPLSQGPTAQTWTQPGPSGAPQQQGYTSSPHQGPHQAAQQPPQQAPHQQPQWGQHQAPAAQGPPGPSPAPQQPGPQPWSQQPPARPQQQQQWASPSQHPALPQQQQWQSPASPAQRPPQQAPSQQYGPPLGHGPQAGPNQAGPSHMQGPPGPPGQQAGPMPEHMSRFESQEHELMARLERIRMNASLNPHQKDPQQQQAAKPAGPPSRPSASKPGENKTTLVHRPAPPPPQGPTALNPGAPVMLGASSVMYDPVLFQQQQMASSQILQQQIEAQRRLLEQTMSQYRVPGQMPGQMPPGQPQHQQGYPPQSPNQGQQYYPPRQ